MKQLTELFASVAHRVRPPICVAMGPPWPVANLVKSLAPAEVVCFQMDLHQGQRARECLAEVNSTAEVVVGADLWDLEQRFNTVIYPAASQGDRELKLDIVEQAYHILNPGGLFLTLSEYEKDTQFAKWHKKVFGKTGQTPSSEMGMAFWSSRGEDIPRRRHEVLFRARVGENPSMGFITRPGTFSYGRFDAGSRAMTDVAEIKPGDRILDLGCGNGAVGCLMGAQAGPNGSVVFIDSNLRALALAAHNAEANGTPNPHFIPSTRLEGLGINEFDVILANPPYYAKSEITKLFVEGTRDLLKRGGRYYIVTKMPTVVVPMIFQTYGDCSVIENRGYSVVMASV